MKLSFTVPPEDQGKSVKIILKSKLALSERLVKKLKYSGQILLNTLPVHVNATVQEGDILEALVEWDELNEDIIPEPMDLDILYEDENLIALNKPSNTVVHPTARHFTGTIANGLMFHLLQKGIKTLVRPVSRLDRDTTGIILFALNPFIQENLVRQMQSRSFKKEYVGLIHGIIKEDRGTINLPIDRLEGSLMLRHVTAEGAPSITHYEVLERFGDITFLRFSLETGRTHQIRVHCQAIGHPLVGDTLYSIPNLDACHDMLMSRHALHSIRTSFVHPFTKQVLELDAPIPPDITHALEILRK